MAKRRPQVSSQTLAPVVVFWIRVSQVLLALGASTLPLEPIGDPIVRLNPFL
jgi:hypothetical protein